jgi:mannose-6-phosphate isomerase-like protein (cupin superfamily)
MSATQTTSMPAWTTGWTAQKPFHLNYNFVPANTPWVPGPVVGMEQRELGLKPASAGKMSARHVRVVDAKTIPGEWRALDADFQFFYILQGSVKVENATGERLTLERGVAAWQPAFLRHRLYDYSSDFEMFEMLAPADPKVYTGKAAPLPERAKDFAHLPAHYDFETPQSYVQGAGPRKFFRYRDLATSGPSDGRIHIHIVQATDPMPGGTGWHTHTMRQLFWVLAGSAGFEVEGHPDVKKVNTYDAVCVAQGQKHDVPSFSSDYRVLEVCMPAEYDTIATDRPKQ